MTIRGALAFLIILIFHGVGVAQERNIAAEIDALARLCSTGTDVKFKGQIEGGLTRFFGKIVTGNGELSIQQSKTDFLNEFDSDEQKVAALKVFTECAVNSLPILYDVKRKAEESGEALIVGKQSSFNDITNKKVALKANLDENGQSDYTFGFSITRDCRLSILLPKGTGTKVRVQILSDQNSEIYHSFMGTNMNPIELELFAGAYFFKMEATRGAGSYRSIVDSNCK